jgi:hypothetical protein
MGVKLICEGIWGRNIFKRRETVETVVGTSRGKDTLLKQGVNESWRCHTKPVRSRAAQLGTRKEHGCTESQPQQLNQSRDRGNKPYTFFSKVLRLVFDTAAIREWRKCQVRPGSRAD